jgi:Cof subfamily protein (haloacid dehalogenase superfamily)
MSFKAVCSDIDGTLLDHRRQLSDETISIFKRLPSHVPVIFASSRMPSALTHLQEELGISEHPLICYNGGYVIRYSNRSHVEVLDSVTIPLNICSAITKLASGTAIHVSLYHEDTWYAPQWDSWSEREARITKVDPRIMEINKVIELWSNDNRGAHKVMCMGPTAEIDSMEKALLKQFSGVLNVYRSRDTYLEIAPKIISKGSALKLLLNKKYNFEISDVIAFGDNYNDIDLIDMAGMGVAVANARDEVKAVANEITLDSKKDGVAVSLKKHFKIA